MSIGNTIRYPQAASFTRKYSRTNLSRFSDKPCRDVVRISAVCPGAATIPRAGEKAFAAKTVGYTLAEFQSIRECQPYNAHFDVQERIGEC